MNITESLLGFKVRASSEGLPPWPSERRQTYLLRTDIKQPLSVDPHIWPDLEFDDSVTAIFDDYYQGSVPNGLGVYTMTSKEKLKRPSLGSIVALTATPKDAIKLKDWHKINDCPITFSSLSSCGFERLGYDVGDRWLLSGLMNCASAANRVELAAKFANALNAFHLFTSAKSAGEFRSEYDRIVTGHAPWFVYGIWSKSLG